MSFQSLSHIPQLRLKYGVDLRRARIDGAESDALYIGLENIESGTGRFVQRADQIESDADQGSAIGGSLCSVFEQGTCSLASFGLTLQRLGSPRFRVDAAPKFCR